jgi:hypothetical protein
MQLELLIQMTLNGSGNATSSEKAISGQSANLVFNRQLELQTAEFLFLRNIVEK